MSGGARFPDPSPTGSSCAFVVYAEEHATFEDRWAERLLAGQAVDLFRPALEVAERMGVIARVRSKATDIERVTVFREGSERPVEVDLGNIYSAISDRHVEIMRDDLAEIFHDATSGDVEYVFGDSIIGIAESGEVTFDRGSSRRFDLVIWTTRARGLSVQDRTPARLRPPRPHTADGSGA